ncbi:MAG: hypothetical protein GY862_05670 [Gammaproteobacteria bacterium]|nr:hypothetical protein [Gammaproteobacteria bacterium]
MIYFTIRHAKPALKLKGKRTGAIYRQKAESPFSSAGLPAGKVCGADAK